GRGHRGRAARTRVTAALDLLRLPTRPVTSSTEGCESGRIGRSRKPLCLRAPWVQIPLPPLPWPLLRDARAATITPTLENRCGASHRGFNSHSLRPDPFSGWIEPS